MKLMPVENAKITIVIPVKNGHDYMEQTINSVISQSYTNWELIIIDDGSTDDTYHIAISYLSDPRVKVLKNPINLGVAKTLNVGIQNADGQYMAVIGADDIWISREKLKNQIDFLRSHPSHVIVGTWAIAGTDKNKKVFTFHHPATDEKIRAGLVYRNLFVASSVLVKMSAMKHIGGFHPEDLLAEDYGLGFRLLQFGLGANIESEDVWYRLNDQGISANKYLMQVNSAYSVVRKLGVGYQHYYPALIKWKAHGLFARFSSPELVTRIKRLFSRT